MLAWLMLAKGFTKLGNSSDAIAAITTYNKLKSKHGPCGAGKGIGNDTQNWKYIIASAARRD